MYKDKSASYSSLIEVCENADNPSLPYVFTLGPAYTRRAICINRLSHIDVVNTELSSSIFIETSTYSKYTSNDTAIPITNSDGMYNGVVMPGIYLVTSSAGNIPLGLQVLNYRSLPQHFCFLNLPIQGYFGTQIIQELLFHMGAATFLYCFLEMEKT